MKNYSPFRVKWLWLPLLVLLIGYLIARAQVNMTRQENSQHITNLMQQRLAQIVAGVENKITLYQYGLRGARGAVMTAGVDNFNYNIMLSYTASRDYTLEFPGSRGFGIIRYVPQAAVADFVAQASADRGKPFQIKQLQPHTDSKFVIQYIEPEQNNSEAIGLDIGSETMRRQAALNAARLNQFQLSGPITLVQAAQKSQQGFLVLMPIYRQQPTPATEQQRIAQLYGWSYTPILIDEVLRTVPGVSDDISLQITDITSQTQQVFFQYGALDSDYIVEQHLALYGRQWSVQMAAQPTFIASLHLPDSAKSFWQNMLVTLLLAILLYFIQMVMFRRRQLNEHRARLAALEAQALQNTNIDLEQQVEQRTRQIAQVNTLQRSILNASSYAIIATDVAGTITLLNPAAEKLLGYSASELVDKHSPALFHLPEEIVKHATELTAELSTPVSADFEAFVAKAKRGIADDSSWTYVRKDGSHCPVRLNISALTNDEGTQVGFLGIAYDLTEQQRREQELATARDNANAANKAKSTFLANMSHEIRTPMNAVLGLLQLLKKTELNDKQLNYLEKTQGASQALLAILNDILDFSKVEAGKIEIDYHSFSLTELMQDLKVINSSDAVSKQLQLNYDIATDIPDRLIGDSLRIKQVLINLTGNAIKFTQQGHVTVTVKAKIIADNHCKVTFEIADSGIGMSQQQLKIIFSGFQQAESSISRRFGGTGLGLAISKRLVELMGGTINVTSTPEVGSQFTFSIEVMIDNSYSDEQPVLSSSLSSPQPLTGKQLLLVEDNLTNQLVASELLQQQGANVDIADSGAAALHMLMQKADYDAVLMDIQMPGMDGYETTRQIRQRLKLDQMLIIAMTANAMQSDIEACRDAGMNAHVAKPFNLAELTAKILQQSGSNWGQQAITESKPDNAVAHYCAAHQIEFAGALHNLGGNLDLYFKVLRQFKYDLQQFNLNLNATTLTTSEALLLFHTLKSSAATLGFSALSTLAANIEQQLKHTVTTAEIPWEKANGLIQKAQHYIDYMLQLWTLKPKAAGVMLTSAQLAVGINELLQKLQTANMAAVGIFERLQNSLQQLNSELTNQLSQAVSTLAFSRAIEVLLVLQQELNERSDD